MKLEKIGKGSSSKKIKHIRIRYFFIWDKIETGKVSLKYCPTEKIKSNARESFQRNESKVDELCC